MSEPCVLFHWKHTKISTLYRQQYKEVKEEEVEEVYMIFHIFIYILHFYGYITNSQSDQLPDGLIAQSVEHCTGIVEVIGSNPVQAWIFSGFTFKTALVVLVTATINHKFIVAFKLSNSSC